MTVLKKIFGCFLLLLSAFLTLSTLLAVLNGIQRSIEEIGKDPATGFGYIIGSLIVIVLFVLLIRFFFRKGLQLLRNQTPVDAIDEIGT